MECSQVCKEAKAAMKAKYETLNPAELKKEDNQASGQAVYLQCQQDKRGQKGGKTTTPFE
jgi:hypothetical protein